MRERSTDSRRGEDPEAFVLLNSYYFILIFFLFFFWLINKAPFVYVFFCYSTTGILYVKLTNIQHHGLIHSNKIVEYRHCLLFTLNPKLSTCHLKIIWHH